MIVGIIALVVIVALAVLYGAQEHRREERERDD